MHVARGAVEFHVGLILGVIDLAQAKRRFDADKISGLRRLPSLSIQFPQLRKPGTAIAFGAMADTRGAVCNQVRTAE
jgi:hypothetical protein